MNTLKLLPLAAVLVGLAGGCANKSSEGAGPPVDASTDGPQDAPGNPPEGKKAGLPPISAAACEEQGGQVVGDIGDGAIFHPDYTCASSGQPPIGVIEPDANGPIAVEGSVCCPS